MEWGWDKEVSPVSNSTWGVWWYQCLPQAYQHGKCLNNKHSVWGESSRVHWCEHQFHDGLWTEWVLWLWKPHWTLIRKQSLSSQAIFGQRLQYIRPAFDLHLSSFTYFTRSYFCWRRKNITFTWMQTLSANCITWSLSCAVTVYGNQKIACKNISLPFILVWPWLNTASLVFPEECVLMNHWQEDLNLFVADITGKIRITIQLD